MTSAETSNTKVTVNELSFPLVTHTVLSNEQFGCYELLKTEHSAELFWIERIGEWISQVWGHKKCETWWGLFTDSIDHLLRFPTPTDTHVSGNHNNGYGHLKTADVRSSVDYRKTEPSMVQTWIWFQNRRGLYFFKIASFLNWLGNLMTWTHGLIILNKTKEIIRFCGSYTFGGKSTLNNCLYHFNASLCTCRK
jgi:hypothetical protein